MWQNISTAPLEQYLAVATIDEEVHAMTFPCVLTNDGWLNAETMKRLEVSPTHWRKWPAKTYFSCCG
jgi:hypothetical protein